MPVVYDFTNLCLIFILFSFHSLGMDGFCCALKHVISVCCCCLKFMNYMMSDLLFNLIIFILVEFFQQNSCEQP